MLTLGLIFCAIGIVLSLNGGKQDVLPPQHPLPTVSNVQQFPMQTPVIWYSPMLPSSFVRAPDSLQAQSSVLESYLIRGAMLFGVVVVVLSTLLVSRRGTPKEEVAENQVRLPEVEAARILEMEHEQARVAIAELSGAHRMEVLRAIITLGDMPEDLPVVQVNAQEHLETTGCI
jgi:hypothetical protein